MENASKALMIAGGILLALLIIASLVYLWTSASNYTTQIEDQKAREQITAFNKQYEAYQRQVLRGSDITSIINKIRDNNKLHAGDSDAQITWQFTLKRGIVGVLPAGTYREANSTTYDNVVNNEKDFKDFKGLYFQCTSIGYSAITGKVNRIVFQERLYEEIFEN